MPRRTDLNHVLVIGSGPIVIGQACEFDYSGTQACRVLRADGLQVSLVNSNPATIMTDPEYADHTYVEPITPPFIERVIAQQAERGNKIDALLATLGGQTALNTAMALHRHGVLEKFKVEMIGATPAVIDKAEDRQKFRNAMDHLGLESPKSKAAHTMDEALEGPLVGMVGQAPAVEEQQGNALAGHPEQCRAVSYRGALPGQMVGREWDPFARHRQHLVSRRGWDRLTRA